MTAPPGDRGQLEFLQHVQRIFDEGEFVATYKFALLIASKQSPGGDRGAHRAGARAIRQPRALGLPASRGNVGPAVGKPEIHG